MAQETTMPVDAERLREEIRKVYSEVVRDPKHGYHFHTGPEYAVERLGYPAQALAELPDSVTAPFAGVGNPLAMGEPRPGETVVDIGAGSGMDSFLGRSLHDLSIQQVAASPRHARDLADRGTSIAIASEHASVPQHLVLGCEGSFEGSV
jgi:hypothetical protein